MKEADERRNRLKDLNKAKTFLEPLNTFEGLTLSFSCKRLERTTILPQIDQSLFEKTWFSPIFTFDFNESKVLEDTYTIFWHFMLNSHITHHEKAHEKVMRTTYT